MRAAAAGIPNTGQGGYRIRLTATKHHTATRAARITRRLAGILTADSIDTKATLALTSPYTRRVALVFVAVA